MCSCLSLALCRVQRTTLASLESACGEGGAGGWEGGREEGEEWVGGGGVGLEGAGGEGGKVNV